MLTAISNISSSLNKNVNSAPLAVFRVLFGLMMLASIVRFWLNGWIEQLYIQPSFHFKYLGFEWVTALGPFTYVLFVVCGLSALMVALGFKYSLAIITFFLSFTYIELIDKTTYLNHYYFISLVAFLLIWLPANKRFSIDAYLNPEKAFKTVPNWTILSIKVLLGIVYFYAGLAKLNSDWLLNAMPLKIWLPANSDLPIIGPLLNETWVHYGMSWAGALYDLTIPFLLFWKRTRIWAFAAVVFFHVLTRALFPIGMFPFIMILSTLIFFSANFHEKLLGFWPKRWSIYTEKNLVYKTSLIRQVGMGLLAFFFFVQFLLPFRFVTQKGELFWHEQGFRFSWRVMLMEKAGYAEFKVKDAESGQMERVNADQFLTAFQQKQMATQADFIIQFAHFLKDEYLKKGMQKPEVYVDSYVAINGRTSQPYVRSDINLAALPTSTNKSEILNPFNHEIKGL
ncbi:MAG: HTTM domain-containing protein [Bacteroidetes bacterium]|nr:HTTM domain-containing protein [Bacteroidota bacterium]